MTLVDGPSDGAVEVTVWDLEMRSPDAIRPGRPPKVEPLAMTAGRPAPELSRFFYGLVGGPWQWVDRLAWTDEQWRAWVDRPEQHLVSCWVDGAPAGYYELEEQSGPDGGHQVEVVYFGVAVDFHGLGLGRWLLTEALRHGWTLGDPSRVWLHTCSLDGPAALANYEARGLKVVRTSTEWRLART